MGQENSFAVDSILRSLDWLENSSRIPIVVPGDTVEFVRGLLPLCNATDKPLFQFIVGLPRMAIRNALIEAAAPPQHRQQLFLLLGEHDRLAAEMEEAIMYQDFELAVKCRDKRYAILKTIGELVPDPIRLMPSHLTGTLKSLGYTGDLTT